MSDSKVSENEILKLLVNLNPPKAAGPDELEPLVLKELQEVIAAMLVVIFQMPIETGRVTKDWNDANMCPLFKKGDISIAYICVKPCNPPRFSPVALRSSA